MKRLALFAVILTAWFCIPAHAQFNGCTSFCGKSSSAVVDGPGFNNNQASGGGSTLACTYTPVTTGTQNIAYTGATPSASGGVPAYTFSETGALPSGLTISSSTGVISGTPTVSGTFTGIQVKIADTVPTTVNCGAAFTLVISPPAFVGAGDIVSGASVWGSCARVYDAALASTSTSLCDLVDSAAPTVVICTLRGSSTGFVDLTGTYCTGSVTPATKCAAATGGVCNVSKVYDQTGNANDVTQTVAATQPALTFSALNGLPGMTFAGAQQLVSPNITFAVPYSFSFVAERTGAFTSFSTVMSNSTGNPLFAFNNSVNTLDWAPNANVTIAANDSVFHAAQGTSATGSSIVYVDGSNASAASTGLGGLAQLNVGARSAALFLTGPIMEFGLWNNGTLFSSTQAGNMNTNQHGASSGYNF